MPKVVRQALVPHSSDNMFEVVNRVDLYDEFLPWCGESYILEQSDDEIVGKIHMKKGPLDQPFTTKNKIVEGRSIDIMLVEGPFKELTGSWTFSNISECGSKINLELNYEFSSSIIELVVGPVFNQIANTLVDSFCKRADELYG